MAYYDNTDEEEKDANGNPIQGSAQSGTISPEAGGTTAATSSTAPAGGAAGPSTQDHFVGIQQYIDANRPQSEKLAESVGSSVTKSGDTARNTLDQQNTLYGQDVANGTVNYNEDIGNKVQNQADQLNDADKSEIKRERDASYSGPNSFQESNYYQPSQQAVQAATQAAENTKTEAGQRQLLNPLEQQAKHGTNAGIGTFDSALLQAAPNARTSLAGARQSVSDIDPKFQQMLSDALQSSTGAKQATQNATTQATGAINQGVQNLNVPQRYQDYLSGLQTSNADEVSRLSRPGEDVTDFFKDVDPNSPTYGVNDYSSYVKQSTPAALGQFASPEDYAKYSALQDLGGQFNFNLNPADAAQAGTAGDMGKLTPDTERLNTDLGAGKAAFTNKLATTSVDQVPGFSSPMSLDKWESVLPQTLVGTPVGSTAGAQVQAMKALDQINQVRQQYGLGKITLSQNNQGVYTGLNYQPNSTISGQNASR